MFVNPDKINTIIYIKDRQTLPLTGSLTDNQFEVIPDVYFPMSYSYKVDSGKKALDLEC